MAHKAGLSDSLKPETCSGVDKVSARDLKTTSATMRFEA